MTARRWLGLIVVAHLALGQVYAWATPIFEAPDEGTHFAFIHWLATGHGLPVLHPDGPDRPWHQEGSQPPLYYALAAPLVRGLDMSDFEARLVDYPLTEMGVPGTTHSPNRYRQPLGPQPLAGTRLAVLVVREFSLLLSAATLLLAYSLARAVYPEREWLAVLTAALAAFNPMALFINASANNDNLLMLLSTAALWVCVRVMQLGARAGWREYVALGGLLGLAALTKISGLVLWPVAGVAVFWGVLGWRDRPPPASAQRGVGPAGRQGTAWRMLLPVAAMFGIALAVCGWWYWRNWQLYGEWLGLNTMVAIAGPRVQPPGLLELLVQEWRGFVLSFWAVFGVFTVLPAAWVQLFYDALMLIALLGGVFTLVRRRGWPRPEALLLALFCGLTLAGVVRWTLQTFASQGRLMFGAIAPLSLFLAAGILAAVRPLLRLRAGRAWAKGFSLTLSAALALVAGVIPVAFIAPRYAPPPPLAEASLPADLRPVHAVFADAIELVGYTASDEAVRPGEAARVTLYWRALAPMARDYALALHLLGRGHAQVGTLDTWPGGGLAATSQWTPGLLMADTYEISVAPDAETPARMALDLYFWDDDPLEPLPRTALDGSPLPSVTLAVGRVVPAQALEAEPEVESGSEFEHGIRLLGYDVSADGALYLTLYWRLEADARVPGDYTVFVHVVDEQGIPVMEPVDGPPLDGDWPTGAWEPGHTLADTRLLALPPNLHPGRYAVRLGFYDPASGARLTAWQPDGTQWPEDTVVLPDVVVK